MRQKKIKNRLKVIQKSSLMCNMKFLNISNSSSSGRVVAHSCFFTLLLAPCCLALAINDEGLPGTVSVPYNDLLPPHVPTATEFEVKEQTSLSITKVLNNLKTENTSTTTKRPTEIPASTLQPTKLVKGQKIKKIKQQQNQKQKQTNQEQLQLDVPLLDLNPEVPPQLNVAIEEVRVAPLTRTEAKEVTSMQKLQNVKAVHMQNTIFQKQLQQQKQQKQQQQQGKYHKSLMAVASRQVNIEQLQQYLHPTRTRRPVRGALPTLTPFPRHVKYVKMR